MSAVLLDITNIVAFGDWRVVIPVLLVLGFVLLGIEVAVPHGVSVKIGGISLLLGVAGVFVYDGATQGLETLAFVSIVLAAFGSLAARRITSRHVQDERYTVAGPLRMAMVGKSARSVSALRPGGVVEVATAGGAERVDAITRGEWIAPDTAVEVVAIEVNFVVVKVIGAGAQGSIN